MKKFFENKKFEILITGTFLLFLALLFIEWHFSVPVIALALSNGELTKTEDKSIKLMIDLSGSIMSWSLATMGAVAAFFKGFGNLKIGMVSSLIILVALIISMFFGHLVVELSLQKLSLNQFPTVDSKVTLARKLQYVFFLLGLSSLGVSVLRTQMVFVDDKI